MKAFIKQRKSVRSYDPRPISPKDQALIEAYIQDPKHLKGVFGHTIKLYYVKMDGLKSEKIGTYGVIKQAPAYVVSVCENTREAFIDCGLVFENLVLYLESIGLNTCWLGGTFNRQKLKLNATLAPYEMIPIISPVGYGADHQSFLEKTMRKLAKSDQRKPSEQLFFENDFQHPLTDATWLETLEYVRLAPSASNQQPWRVVVSEDQTLHFYLERTPNYGGGKLGYDIQMVDMGIAISHYLHVKVDASVQVMDPEIAPLSDLCEYIVSIK